MHRGLPRAGRGVAASDALRYLEPKLRALLPDPTVLLDMGAAAQRLAQAVVGFDLAYFRDGQFFSEYRARDAFSGREAEATIGLRNRWQVAPGIRLDASFERVNPIKGGAGAEATAVTAAIEYTRSPLWKGTLRAEYRNASSGDNFLATLGYARKLTRD